MILVTGGSGFCGSFIVKQLLDRGEKVRNFDRIDLLDQHPNLEYFRGDILLRDDVAEACRGADTLIHTVALVPISKAGRRFADVNVGGTRTLIEKARKAGVKKIVHLSSSAIFGTPPMPIGEDAPYNPVGPYGTAKMKGEMVCRDFIKKGVDISIVRPRTVVGPGRLGIFQILFDWISRGKNIYIIGPGNNLFQFLHAEDLADCCVRMAQRPGPEIFNIGTDSFGTLRDDLESLCRHAGTNCRVKSLPVLPTILALKTLDALRLCPLAPWHYLTYHKDFYFDNRAAKRKLGWKPRHGNVDMLCEAYDWYLENRGEAEGRVGTSHRFSIKQGILKILRSFS